MTTASSNADPLKTSTNGSLKSGEKVLSAAHSVFRLQISDGRGVPKPKAWSCQACKRLNDVIA
jgi:hypothetical protein